MTNDTIYSRFAEISSLDGQLPAITTDKETLTYAALNERVDAIMQKLDVSPGEVVGIKMSHCPDMIAAMLAVLKSGCAYIPAEPSLPSERIGYMMKSADAVTIITDDFCRDLTPADAPLPDRSTPAGLAYILYTSGTTGRPKGVMVENRNVVNYAEAFKAEFDVRPSDVMLQYSVCSFDIFVEEVFTTLLNGATLAIPSKEVMEGGLGPLLNFCRRHKVTEISGFPYLLADMNNANIDLPSLRLLISGGDVLRASYITNLHRPGLMIYNTYGPSETTVCASYQRVDNTEPLPDGTFPIGRPVKGVSIEIRNLNHPERRLKDGAIGEICIFGKGMSRGYLNNPPEQENFMTTADGRRMYRSGDLGYVLPNGNIAFLHRKDRQVMILGKRVEPAEVENVLNESPDVERGVVRTLIDSNGLAYLVAYLVPGKREYSLAAVKSWLKSKLADFMVPEFFVRLQELPLTPHGKVDYRALPVVVKSRHTYL